MYKAIIRGHNGKILGDMPDRVTEIAIAPGEAVLFELVAGSPDKLPRAWVERRRRKLPKPKEA